VHDVFILSAVRTPIGKFGGSLVSMTAADMGVVAAEGALQRAGVQPEQVEETIFGKLAELTVRQQLSASMGFQQKWGSANASCTFWYSSARSTSNMAALSEFNVTRRPASRISRTG